MLWLGVNGFLLGYVLYPMIQEGRTDYPWFTVLMLSVATQSYVRVTKIWEEEKKELTGELIRLRRHIPSSKALDAKEKLERMRGKSESVEEARIRDLELEPAKLDEVIGELVDFVRPTADNSNVRIHTYVSPDLPAVPLNRDLFKSMLPQDLRPRAGCDLLVERQDRGFKATGGTGCRVSAPGTGETLRVEQRFELDADGLAVFEQQRDAAGTLVRGAGADAWYRYARRADAPW